MFSRDKKGRYRCRDLRLFFSKKEGARKDFFSGPSQKEGDICETTRLSRSEKV